MHHGTPSSTPHNYSIFFATSSQLRLLFLIFSEMLKDLWESYLYHVSAPFDFRLCESYPGSRTSVVLAWSWFGQRKCSQQPGLRPDMSVDTRFVTIKIVMFFSHLWYQELQLASQPACFHRFEVSDSQNLHSPQLPIWHHTFCLMLPWLAQWMQHLVVHRTQYSNAECACRWIHYSACP